MLKTLLFSITFLGAVYLTAQDFEYIPNFSTISEELDLTDDFIYSTIDAEIANNSEELSSLIWKIEQIEGPSTWQVQLSVNDESGGGFGWGETTNDKEGYPVLLIEVGESSKMNLSVRPRGEAGCGIFKISVAHSSDPDNIIEIGTYEYKINSDANCLTSTNDFDAATIKLFPNPTNLSFKLENTEDLAQFRIINTVGREVLSSSYTPGQSYEIFHLRSGLYFVQAQDANGQILKTLRLIKK